MIGVGYWGPNLIRNFSELDDAQIVWCSDLSQDRLNKIAKRYPAVKCTTNFEDLLTDPEVDAVVIATPVSTHYPIAKAALDHGKHVMIEKPLADSAEHALALVELAKRVKRVLMVDHTFIYTSAVRKMRELIESGDLGEILYFDSIRVNLGLFQKDINVIWDLAPHDLSIMDYLLRAEPIAVSAIGASHAGNDIANIGYMTLRFANNVIAHFHVNWLAPVKIRQTLLGCRSEEHTSELQSPCNLVCRLLLAKKKAQTPSNFEAARALWSFAANHTLSMNLVPTYSTIPQILLA